VQLHRELAADLDRNGAQLIVIGNGRPSFIEGFREKAGYEGPLYTDPSRRSYRALGFRRGIRVAALNFSSARHAITALRGGYRQTRTAGDPWQLGGVLIATTEGDIVYEYVSAFAGDHPAASGVAEALTAACRPGDRSASED